MHIAIAGPLATADIAHLLDDEATRLPRGIGGAPLLVTLITELLRGGHQVTAITMSAGMPLINGGNVVSSGNRLRMIHVPMRPHAWRPNGMRPGRILDFLAFERRALVAALRAASPDVVHAHWAYEYALAAIDSGLPHVVTCHDAPRRIVQITRSMYRALRMLMARRALREARCITAVSPYICEEIRNMSSVPIDLVPNPVDPAAFARARARKAGSALRIAMVCNGWGPIKNPEPALRAFAAWRDRRPGAQLHLYGHDFEPEGRAHAWTRDLGISENLVFHGPLQHEQLLEALSSHDVLLHPSVEESFGMVLAEAMAMGLPVIGGHRSGAVPWLVEAGGALCDVNDESALVAALDTVAEPKRYAAFSCAGIAGTQARFSAATVADSFVALYERACRNQTSDMPARAEAQCGAAARR